MPFHGIGDVGVGAEAGDGHPGLVEAVHVRLHQLVVEPVDRGGVIVAVRGGLVQERGLELQNPGPQTGVLALVVFHRYDVAVDGQ